MVHREYSSCMRCKYRTFSVCGNLCHLRHSLRHTAARAEIQQEETRGKRTATRISMLPFHNQTQTFGTKSFDQRDYAFDRYQFPAPVHSSRFTDYQEPPSRATLHQLLQGLATATPSPAAVLPPPLLAISPPVVPGPLGHPIPA
jgi:hypothetical protein